MKLSSQSIKMRKILCDRELLIVVFATHRPLTRSSAQTPLQRRPREHQESQQ